MSSAARAILIYTFLSRARKRNELSTATKGKIISSCVTFFGLRPTSHRMKFENTKNDTNIYYNIGMVDDDKVQ